MGGKDLEEEGKMKKLFSEGWKRGAERGRSPRDKHELGIRDACRHMPGRRKKSNQEGGVKTHTVPY